MQVLEWFNVKLGLPYMPASHGSVPEWLLSVVSVHLQVNDDEVWYGFQSSEALGKAAEQFALHDMVRSAVVLCNACLLFGKSVHCACQPCLFRVDDADDVYL